MSEEERNLTRKIVILLGCLIFFGFLFYTNLLSTTIAPTDWTYSVGQTFILFHDNDKQLFNIIEFWYSLALFFFIVYSAYRISSTIIKFIKFSPEKTHRVLEIIYMILMIFGPYAYLSTAKKFLGIIPRLDPEYRIQTQILAAISFDPSSWFLDSTTKITEFDVNLSVIVSGIYTVSFSILGLFLGYRSNSDLLWLIIQRIKLPKTIGNFLQKSVSTIQNDNLLAKYSKISLLFYCGMFFFAFFFVHIHTISNWPFSWISASVDFFAKMSTESNIIDVLEFWYFVAFLIFFAMSLIPLILTVFFYGKRQRIGIKKHFLVFEIMFLTTISLSPFFGLHTARLVLDHIPIIDPEYDFQVSYLQNQLKIDPENWNFQISPLEKRTSILKDYSYWIAGGYLSTLFITSLLVLYVDRKGVYH